MSRRPTAISALQHSESSQLSKREGNGFMKTLETLGHTVVMTCLKRCILEKLWNAG